MLADESAKYIEQANTVAYIVVGIVLVVAMICATIIKLKTGEWPWENGHE